MPVIPSGTGLEISTAVYNTLDTNNILDKTEAFVFDLTSSNTDKFIGACNLLEKKMVEAYCSWAADIILSKLF